MTESFKVKKKSDEFLVDTVLGGDSTLGGTISKVM